MTGTQTRLDLDVDNEVGSLKNRDGSREISEYWFGGDPSRLVGFFKEADLRIYQEYSLLMEYSS